jgi:peptidoglycan/xylan/chitin deacetylase (PgdA/CDA1 family)
MFATLSLPNMEAGNTYSTAVFGGPRRAWSEDELRGERHGLRALRRKLVGQRLAAGWDFVGHGYVQRPMHRVEDQRSAIHDTIEAIRTITGKPPRGWESPGLTETAETLDHLAEAGIEYVCDLCVDDQPVMIQASPRPIVAMPYTVEINDVVITAVQGHRSDEFFLRGVDHFDRLYKEGASNLA